MPPFQILIHPRAQKIGRKELSWDSRGEGRAGHNHHIVLYTKGTLLLTLQKVQQESLAALDRISLEGCRQCFQHRCIQSRGGGVALKEIKVTNVYKYFKHIVFTIPGIFGFPLICSHRIIKVKRYNSDWNAHHLQTFLYIIQMPSDSRYYLIHCRAILTFKRQLNLSAICRHY